MSKTHANRMIDSAEVVGNLTPIGVIPATESQARPLTVLEPEAQREAWQRAVETAPNGKVTAAHVQATVSTFRPSTPDALPDWVTVCPSPLGRGRRDWCLTTMRAMLYSVGRNKRRRQCSKH